MTTSAIALIIIGIIIGIIISVLSIALIAVVAGHKIEWAKRIKEDNEAVIKWFQEHKLKEESE